MTQDEKKAYVASLFQERTLFESKVLDIQKETDRMEVFEIIAQKLVNKTLPGSLHFSYLKSYDDLRLDGIVPAMVELIAEEVEYFLQEKLKYSRVMAKETVVQNLRFLRLLCQAYYTRYGYMIFEKIADTFFNNMAALNNPKVASRVLVQSIEGGSNPPLTAFKNSRRAVYSLEQTWQRVHQAYIARKERVGKIQLELSELLTAIEKLQNVPNGEKKSLLAKYAQKEQLLSHVREKPLDQFNGTVKQMKKAIMQRLADMSEEG